MPSPEFSPEQRAAVNLYNCGRELLTSGEERILSYSVENDGEELLTKVRDAGVKKMGNSSNHVWYSLSFDGNGKPVGFFRVAIVGQQGERSAILSVGEQGESELRSFPGDAGAASVERINMFSALLSTSQINTKNDTGEKDELPGMDCS